MTYEEMTIEELQAEFVRLGSDLVAVSNSRQEILALMEKRKAAALAKASVASLNDLERDALREVLGPALKPDAAADVVKA